MKNLVQKIVTQLLINLLLTLPLVSIGKSLPLRPTSSPYLSGDSFRALADHRLDRDYHKEYNFSPAKFEQVTKFDPKQVKAGDIVFVDLDVLGKFFQDLLPQIKHSFILITHNHDHSAPGKYHAYLDDPKLIAWFSQNPDITDHPKFYPIPIGLSNKHWNHSKLHAEKIATAQQQLRTIKPVKQYLLYANINVHTCPRVRQPVYDFFIKQPFCSWYANRNYADFLNDLAAAKFVLSPHGNGLDCHRTWEALYMGSYPVVKTSALDPLYIDLPVLIVPDWSAVTVELLEQKYQEFSNREFKLDKLYFDYWQQLIKQIQANYRTQQQF
ncbi:MAG TPA: hypothetical protein VJJ83_05340 [Candidatus Babeliales bacterium]|nr:MAG: hypothetical protein A3F67_01030 [Verrucomicrobia bacterium RIFCSPHIGHO2_12_FULL_41_10]HLB41189.1 hypothetical protein [Candidatus Babeliales bacterium]